ncbi:molecular chaperone DnaJ [bacterium]|nr:molecular chaperone DnaJ [bacterium]
MTNYYEILGIEKNASQDEIKRAFRQKARTLHPDVNKAPDAEEKFKELGKAYETLMDAQKREMYDRYGEDGLKNAGYDTSGPFDFGFGNLNDIFETFFGGFGMGGFSGGFHSNPNAPQDGDDLRLDVQLTFEEAVFGVQKELVIDRLETCSECNGTGAQQGTQRVTCPTCNGVGQIKQTTQTILGHITQVTACPKCHGKGTIIENPCKKCHGQGLVQGEKKLTVTIPAGVDNGSKIRLSAEGDAGKNGGLNGDLYIVLHVEPHKTFKRDGFDVYSEVEITFPQAVLGDEISIDTLEGVEKMTIPSGVQAQEVLPRKGKGIPNLGRKDVRGNHYVVVNIKTPTNLSEEEKRLYSRLKELQNNKKDGFFDKVKNVINK